MKIATLYKITNTINGLFYWGIVYGKNKTVLDRFEEHMTGKGGTLLYKEGVLLFGRENFIVEEIVTGPVEELRILESEYNKLNLWPVGYNGNTAHAIVLTDEQQARISATKKEKFKNNPESKPIPPNWKGKKRSDTMKARLKASKMGHVVDDSTKEKISKSWTARAISDPGTCNRKPCLAIDPAGEAHYSVMGKCSLLYRFGIYYPKANLLNTGKPISAIGKMKPKKIHGWIIYDDPILIKTILPTLEKVTTYEA